MDLKDKLYNSISMKIFLPLGDKITHQCVMSYYSFINNAQWWDREKLEDYQNNKLVHLIRTAYSGCSYYKELFDKYKIKTENIKTLDDLHKLPISTKSMLRNAYPDKCIIKTKWAWREYSTSGSTGQQFTVRVDNYSMSIARALMLLRANFAGWQIGYKYLQTGMSLKRGFTRKAKDILLRVTYVSAFNLSNEIIDIYLETIEKNKIKFIMGYAASLYLIAERAKEKGFNYKLEGIVSWGDNMFPHYRSLLERQFKCLVTDTYGCGEGIQIAAQCGKADGDYHIFSPHVAVEFTKDGYPVSLGEDGDIVLTRLDPGAMPLIRYKVGDVGRGSVRKSCPCGRGLPMMASIAGRDTDIITTPRGNRLIVHFFTGIFEYAKTIDTFQVVQNVPDEIIVKIVPRENFHASHWDKIKKEILEKGDPDLKINMEIVQDIPLEKSNKRRFVISKL